MRGKEGTFTAGLEKSKCMSMCPGVNVTNLICYGRKKNWSEKLVRERE